MYCFYNAIFYAKKYLYIRFKLMYSTIQFTSLFIINLLTTKTTHEKRES